MDTPLTEWKQDYHWMKTELSNDDLKKCWRSLAKMVTPGAWQERRAIRAEHRAAQLEAERDEARAALVRYQDERVQLLGRIEELAVRVKELEDSDAAFSRDLSEALNSGNGVYRP